MTDTSANHPLRELARMIKPATCLLIAASVVVAGCGGGSKSGDEAATKPQPENDPIAAAAQVSKSDFPAPAGRSMEAFANTINAGPQLGLAVGTFTPGKNRIAFGLLNKDNSFLYAKSAVYVARSGSAPALGPYPAPADSMEAAPRYRSRGADDPSEAKAVYSTTVELPKPGKWVVLVVAKDGARYVGAGARITVARKSSIPAVGDRAPAVDTDTASSVAGQLQKIDTRDPHDDMHEVSFKDVVGKKPVALIMATPALCQSRVCGPVTDIAVQMKNTYGDRMTFIHQEVYVDNDLKKGLRPPLRAFNLHSEPWLFTVDARGRVAARLEGAFGVNEFRRAVEAAL